MPLLVTSHKTPVGTLNLLADDQILIGANLSTVSAFKAGRDVKVVKTIPVISDLVSDYFDGDLTALNGIQVRQPGAPFSQAAWKAMSYADLADKAGSPAAVRAAGSACANNAIMLVVPCHRVVKTGGALGNYAYGVEKKQWLLSHEGFL